MALRFLYDAPAPEDKEDKEALRQWSDQWLVDERMLQRDVAVLLLNALVGRMTVDPTCCTRCEEEAEAFHNAYTALREFAGARHTYVLNAALESVYGSEGTFLERLDALSETLKAVGVVA